MPTYVAFLRAINLGANRKFPKDDIRRTVEAAGFSDVQTHINTGNVRLTSSMRSRPKIEATLEAAFAADRGFEVPTIVFTSAELSAIADDALGLAEQHPGLARHYIYLLKDEPSPELKSRVEATSSERGNMVVRGRAVHALLWPGYQDGVVDPLGAARLLEPATNRNAAVIQAIVDKWC
ncbi:DUF1697 domain-containing protein [Tessaracoccus sp. HDW20]|uniref:DUF1697 domain-containing protein n=1 Tax=Tessaracoccus coleopterorum TaxID=2714950 RepID=UPI0018D3249B|nr:DUF1697 domain-containing protein [Tessaracoccus coleopterorum]NHB83952.1 DUF1697 domain-containing protein [Tessaracoccus coleopterorum]